MRALVERIASEAAKALRENFGKEGIDRVLGYHGSDSTRLIDKISEDLIIESFVKEGIKATFVTEESGVIFKGDEYFILIDPLDGSTNFVSGVPWSSVSIAVYRPRSSFLDSLAGAVVNVFTNDVYSYEGGKSFHNGKEVARPDKFRNVLLVYVNKRVIDTVAQFVKSLDRDYKLRSYGAASLDMILVCTGNAALYADVRGRLRNIDIAASANFCNNVKITPVNLEGKPLNDVSIKEVIEVKEVVTSPYSELLSTFLLSARKVSP